MLNWQAPILGDPGLLVGEMTGLVKSNVPRYRAGLVVHHSQRLNPDFSDLLARRGVACILGATKDYRAVAEQIADCAVILSSSLHGLVFADALGIPNTWFMPDTIHGAARFKFYDYACALGRVLEQPVDVAGLGAAIRELTRSRPAYLGRVPALVQSIKNAFPAHLRSVSEVDGRSREPGRVLSSVVAA
jgi:hypothetical protein